VSCESVCTLSIENCLHSLALNATLGSAAAAALLNCVANAATVKPSPNDDLLARLASLNMIVICAGGLWKAQSSDYEKKSGVSHRI
jgi:uridylate kinase